MTHGSEWLVSSGGGVIDKLNKNAGESIAFTGIIVFLLPRS